MKFLVDAQLPRKLARWLQEQGHDALHTLDLPKGNLTSDREINRISVEQKYIVITKDSDFVDSFWLEDRPYKLLLISTGNITNAALLEILKNNLSEIVSGLESYYFVELDRERLLFLYLQ